MTFFSKITTLLLSIPHKRGKIFSSVSPTHIIFICKVAVNRSPGLRTHGALACFIQGWLHLGNYRGFWWVQGSKEEITHDMLISYAYIWFGDINELNWTELSVLKVWKAKKGLHPWQSDCVSERLRSSLRSFTPKKFWTKDIKNKFITRVFLTDIAKFLTNTHYS